MVEYLTYAQYQAYGGTLDQATFNQLAFEAQAKIDWYTFNRLHSETEITDERIFRLMYRLIQLIHDKMVANAVPDTSGQSGSVSAAVASQSNDGVSISYNIVSASELVKKVDNEIEECIQQYLQGVTNNLGRKLLYKGFYPGE